MIRFQEIWWEIRGFVKYPDYSMEKLQSKTFKQEKSFGVLEFLLVLTNKFLSFGQFNRKQEFTSIDYILTDMNNRKTFIINITRDEVIDFFMEKVDKEAYENKVKMKNTELKERLRAIDFIWTKVQKKKTILWMSWFEKYFSKTKDINIYDYENIDKNDKEFNEYLNELWEQSYRFELTGDKIDFTKSKIICSNVIILNPTIIRQINEFYGDCLFYYNYNIYLIKGTVEDIKEKIKIYQREKYKKYLEKVNKKKAKEILDLKEEK